MPEVSDEPKVAQKGPYKVELMATYRYAWCACGLSKSQPFCDGSHEGTGFEPMEWTARRTQTISFCTCKRTTNAPICDDSHLKL